MLGLRGPCATSAACNDELERPAWCDEGELGHEWGGVNHIATRVGDDGLEAKCVRLGPKLTEHASSTLPSPAAGSYSGPGNDHRKKIEF